MGNLGNFVPLAFRETHESESDHSYSVNERFVAQQLTVLAEEGGDAEEVLRWAGIECRLDTFLRRQLNQMDPSILGRLSARSAVVIANIDAQRTGRPPFRGQDWQLMVYCVIAGPSLRESISRACDFFRAMDGRFGSIELLAQPDIAELRFDRQLDPFSRVGFLGSLHGMINLHGLFSWLIGSRIPVLKAVSGYAEQMRSVISPELLPFPMDYGADRTALSMSSGWLDYPVVRTVEDVQARSTMSFTVAIDKESAEHGIPERARRAMFMALRQGEGLRSLDELADEVGLNRETFRRRLRGEGWSYNRIKDSCRRELGLELLYRTQLSMEVISDRLCFCDSDEFRRAMHKWTGTTPSDYRRAIVSHKLQ